MRTSVHISSPLPCSPHALDVSMAYMVMAYIVTAYILMTCIVMA